ncbi:MAG: glutamate--tRNA ligase [Gemmatimonadota bacterium]
MAMRLRFAPSPTGYLHVGGARTALFNWLLARAQGGVFILRVEDTDRERSTEAATQAILDGMQWLDLSWDEGPFFQSRGLERHRQEAHRLLERGLAYRDFSTPDEIEADRKALKLGERRPYRTRADALGADLERERLDAGAPFAIRFRVPDGETVWDDLVHGEMRFANADIEDLVVLRADGTPTYNLAVVSDDADMRITHVIRGDDHLSNTPKQILLYDALGYDLPRFGHVPLILGTDGKRLSKRHGATAVGDYRVQGILPETMVNFLALLGWNPGDEQEVMTRDELVQRFSMERVLKKSAVFDPEKLAWLNGQHLARRSAESLLELVRDEADRRGQRALLDGEAHTNLIVLVEMMKVRARTIPELFERMEPLLLDAPTYDPQAVRQHWKHAADARARLLAAAERFQSSAWDAASLEAALRALAEERGEGAAKLIHPLRVALTGQSASAGIFDLLVWLGPERTAARIDRALGQLPDA